MRKLLIVVGLTLLTTGAVFAATSPTAEPAIETPATASPQLGQPLQISFPDPIAMTGCTASQNCSNGSTVQCTGWDVCQVFSAAVSCDGTVVSCPHPCAVSTTCCTGRTISCSGNESCEVQEAMYVRCDGGYPNGTMGFCALCPDYPY